MPVTISTGAGSLTACCAPSTSATTRSDTWEDHAQWGLPKPGRWRPGQRIWIPRGITFPWYVEGELWRLNVRRPLTPRRSREARPSTSAPPALPTPSTTPAACAACRPVVLVEGEIDALTIVQACGEQVAAVATGSTAGARRSAWVARLALAPVVLVAFDADKAGRTAHPAPATVPPPGGSPSCPTPCACGRSCTTSIPCPIPRTCAAGSRAASRGRCSKSCKTSHVRKSFQKGNSHVILSRTHPLPAAPSSAAWPPA